MLDAIDRKIVAATQAGLPLEREPYRAIAEQVGLDQAAVINRLERLLHDGAIRRIGAIPNHYALGFTANGMSVWDVADEAVAEIGAKIGALDEVTHCYERPRHLPLWPYNLFAMVHGHTRQEVTGKVARIAELVGTAARAHDILFSTRILKKTGLRIAA
jgi:DNA-binding Lrp family transcriptional regulator